MEKYIMNPGTVNCLGGCNKKFESKDKATNRICPSCSKKRAKDRTPRIVASRINVDDRSISLEPEE